ncbi:hypothetical protein [Corynebacterium striatum]|uniref:hypothetical protein n=1 Tax=Corynebacterium striatum TaxID=43770 RepID=UPI003F7D43A6
MTDLSTTNLKRLLAEVTPGPWKHDNEVGEILGAYYEKNGIGYIPTVGYADDYNADLIALAPELLAEVIRMREALRDLSEVWEAISIDPTRTPAEQQLAAAVVDHIDQILGDHDDQL